MNTVSYVRQAMAQSEWKSGLSLTTAQSALTTSKSATTINALTSTGIAIISPRDNSVALEIRFRGGSDGDSNILNLYAMRGDNDHYTRIAVLTLTTGTQTDGTNLFIDTISKANEKWTDTIEVVSDASNGIAKVALNTHGYSKFLVIATTLNSSPLYIDWCRE